MPHRAFRMQEFLAEHRTDRDDEFFPAYAPERNPTQYVWSDPTKVNPLANLAFFDVDQLTAVARRHRAIPPAQARPSPILPEPQPAFFTPQIEHYLYIDINSACPSARVLSSHGVVPARRARAPTFHAHLVARRSRSREGNTAVRGVYPAALTVSHGRKE